MNTTFRPSEFDKQAAASLDMMDVEAAQSRVDAILHPKAGPTLTSQPQTQPQAPAQRNRKPRSDKGIPKGPKMPADPDEISIKMSVDLARHIATACAEAGKFEAAAYIQDEVIGQIKKRLDALTKGK